MARECVFCGTTPVTAEHAWPDWIDKEVPLRGPASVLHTPTQGAPYWRGQHIRSRNTRVRRVCKTCNEGWMSELEEAVKPILRPMLNGIARTLNDGEQATLATWAVKTAWMLDFIDSGHHPVVPKDHYSILMNDKTPPAGVYVLAATYSGTKYGHYWWQQSLRFPPEKTAGIPPPHGYFSTLCIGEVVIQVAGITAQGPTIRNLDPSHFVQIWPYVTRIMWPPPLVLSDASLEVVSQGTVPFFG